MIVNLFGSNIPLHAIAVHFPVSLSVLVPFVFLILLIGITKGYFLNKIWVAAVCLQVLLFLSVLGAAELGEHEEDRVEKVVEKKMIEEHAEWGERLEWAQGLILIFAGSALVFQGRLRLKKVATVASFLGVIPAGLAGHSGGELVYKHGAGRAYYEGVQH